MLHFSGDDHINVPQFHVFLDASKNLKETGRIFGSVGKDIEILYDRCAISPYDHLMIES